MKRKILFLKPYDFMHTEYNGTSNPQFSPIFPCSLATVLSWCKSHLGEDEFSFYGLDGYLFQDRMEGVLREVALIDPDYIVSNINVLTFHLVESYYRNMKGKAKLIGLINKAFPEDMVARYGDLFDAIIEKDWCSSTLSVIVAAEDGEIGKSPGVWLRDEGGKPYFTGKGEPHYISDYPLPAYREFHGERYNSFFSYWTEGCKYGCIFCSFGTAVYGRWRARPIESILEELKELYSIIKRPMYILNIDNELTLQREWAEDLFEAIEKASLPLSIDTNIRANHVDEEFIRSMKRGGITRVGFSLESSDSDVLQLNKKKLNWEDVDRTIRLLKKHNIIFQVYIMQGMYGSNRQKDIDTFRYVVDEMKVRNVGLGVTLPYRSTPYYRVLKKKEWIEDFTLDNYLWVGSHVYKYSFFDKPVGTKPFWRISDDYTFEEAVDTYMHLAELKPRKKLFADFVKPLMFGNPSVFGGYIRSVCRSPGYYIGKMIRYVRN
ncbi:MAG: radical SAM protein [Candidatus Dadabacteria bacterium]|nr:MAG: radical SAM protein [Candidatus Dadabacteria bacterium]